MIDPNKSIAIIKGGLIEPVKTWESYLAENHTWQETVALITGPLIIASAIAAAILSWIFSSHYMFSGKPGISGFLVGIVAAFAGFFLAVFIFSFFAGVFKGKNDFNRGVAAVSLATIPTYVGSILGALPWIGGLLSLAMSIVGLVFLYKIIPSYLEVPQAKRVVHFVASLVTAFVAALLIGTVLGLGGYSSSDHFNERGDQGGTGMFGKLGYQAELMEQAGKDRYEPPADGKISDDQIVMYLTTIRKVTDLRAEQRKALEQFEQENKDKKDFSIADIGGLASGMNAMMGSVNAEMEVVKTGGGNWAEYSWIGNQLRIAMIQKDIDDAVKHNYALYQAHESELRAFLR